MDTLSHITIEMVTFVPPTVAEFVALWPTYDDPEYTDNLAQILVEANSLYGQQISKLPTNDQQLAFQYIVCHLFQLLNWEACGYAGAPNEIRSRNDTVIYKGSMKGLNGTGCGLKYLTLIRNKIGGMWHAGREDLCKTTPKCGC